MKLTNLCNINAKEVVQGYFGKFINSQNMSMAIWEVKADSPLPEHKHINEQITMILKGKFKMIVDGKTQILESGSVIIIPSNVPHSGLSITDCKIIDAFHPVREDFKNK